MRKVLLLSLAFILAIPTALGAKTCFQIREEDGEAAYRLCNLQAQEKTISDAVKSFRDRVDLQKDHLDFTVEQQLNVLEQQWREMDLRHNDQVNHYEQLIGQMEIQNADDSLIDIEEVHLDAAEDLQNLQKKMYNAQKKQIQIRRKLDEEALNITQIQNEMQLRTQLLRASGY